MAELSGNTYTSRQTGPGPYVEDRFTGIVTSSSGALGASGTTTVTDCLFDGNTSSGGAGAISIGGKGDVTVTGTTFADNLGGEGTIYIYLGNLTISGSTFTGNTSSKNGIVFNQGGTLTIGNVVFDSNTTSGDYKGAIYTAATGGTNPVTTINGTITLMSTSEILYFRGAAPTIDTTAFFAEEETWHATVINAAGYAPGTSTSWIKTYGGGQYIVDPEGYNVIMDNTGYFLVKGDYTTAGFVSDRNTHALAGADGTHYAGIRYASVSDALSAQSIVFMNAAVDTLISVTNGKTLTVFDTEVVASGTFSVAGSGTLNLENTQFSGNSVRAIMNYGNINITDSMVRGYRGGEGAFIYSYDSNGKVAIHGSTFSGNSSSSRGGVIEVQNGSQLTVGDAVFDGNTAAGGGGALYVNGGTSGILIDGKITLVTATDTIVTNVGNITIDAAEFFPDEGTWFAQVVESQGTGIGSGSSWLSGSIQTPDGFNAVRDQSGYYLVKGEYTGAGFVSGTNTHTYIDDDGNRYAGVRYATASGAMGSESLVFTDTDEAGQITVGSGKTLFVHDVTLTGHSASNDGGVFVNNGTLEIRDAELSGNRAKGGGAVRNNAALIFDHAVISDNTAGEGGAIYNPYASATITATNTVFAGNRTTGSSGGAIKMEGGGTLTASNTVFSGNTAGGGNNGGAIYNNASRVILTGVTFGGNSAKQGAAIGLTGAAVTEVNGGTFGGNTASEGAAIIGAGTTTLANVIFDGNSATESVIYMTGGTWSAHNVTFSNNSVTKNGALQVGGGAMRAGNLTFNNNTAGSGGKALHVSGNATMTLDGKITLVTANDTIKNNASIVADADAFFTDETVWFAQVIDAQAFGVGYSPSWLDSGSTGTISVAGEYSGTIMDKSGYYLVKGDYTAAGFVSDTDTHTYVDAAGVRYAGIRYANSADALEAQSVVVMDKAEIGRIGILLGKTLIVHDVTIDGHSVSANGGAFAANGELRITDSTLSGNTVTAGGGAIMAYNSTKINTVNFIGNSAREGGAIYIYADDRTPVVEIADAVFSGNRATSTAGGAIKNDSGTLTVTGTTFTGNRSGEFGGAIYNKQTADLTRVYFSGNTGYGGAIYNVDGAVMTLTGATFNGNSTANYGGAIFNAGTLTVTDSEFLTATDSIYNRGAMTLTGRIGFNAAITGRGTITLTDGTEVTFGNAGEIEVRSGMTFGSGNTINFGGSAAVNFTVDGGQDLSDVAITVDGSVYTGSEVVVATGVSAIDSYTVTGADDLTLYTAGGKMVLDKVSNTMSDGQTETNFVGGTSNLITGGTVTAAFFGTRKNTSGSVRTVFTGGTVSNSMIAGALVKADESAALDTVSVDIYDGVSLLGGPANGGMNYVAGYAYGASNATGLPGSANYTVQSAVLNLSGSSINGNLYAGAHARKYAYTSVGETVVTVTGGIVEKLYGGGWAERYGQSDVGTATVDISGGSVGRLYAGGGNAANAYTYTTTADITISGGTVDFVFLGGRNINCFVGDATLTITGAAQRLTRISGHNDCGFDKTTGTAALNVQTNVTLGYLDYVDQITIAENCTLNVTDLVLYDDISQELSVYL
ncbi:MAG: hypothetical protein MR051_05410, partial [Lentisphaeria bacterium]|nr:hypothetical protein [Lentisphaeria bacterium]